MLRDVQHMVDQGEITATSAANGYYAFGFVLTDLIDYSQWTSVFDQYKINMIEVDIVAMTLLPAPSTGAQYSLGYVAIDYDDNVVPTSIGQIQAYSNSMILRPSRDLRFSLQPKTATEVQSTFAGATAGAGVSNSQWLDCTYNSVPHYGIKAAIVQSTSTNLTRWRILLRYHVSFRSVR